MKILHISDTHGWHGFLKLPDLKTVDVIVFTGDESDYRDYRGEEEFFNFIEWYENIDHPYKIFIPGNHSMFCFKHEKEAKKVLKEAGIIYLNKDEITIDGVKFYGDPICPAFGNWFFMTNRQKMYKHWDLIPEDTNVLLTHTPSKGILDLSYDRLNNIEMCGCSNLGKRIKNLKELKLHCFGHIHNNKDIVNTGLRIIDNVIFSNAAAVEDGRFEEGIKFHGNFMEI